MNAPMPSPDFVTKFASSDEDVQAAQALRYDVFVRELGSDGPMVDHGRKLEKDAFDAHSEHLLLFIFESVKLLDDVIMKL